MPFPACLFRVVAVALGKQIITAGSCSWIMRALFSLYSLYGSNEQFFARLFRALLFGQRLRVRRRWRTVNFRHMHGRWRRGLDGERNTWVAVRHTSGQLRRLPQPVWHRSCRRCWPLGSVRWNQLRCRMQRRCCKWYGHSTAKCCAIELRFSGIPGSTKPCAHLVVCAGGNSHCDVQSKRKSTFIWRWSAWMCVVVNMCRHLCLLRL